MEKMWKRKYFDGKFQHFCASADVVCFKSSDGWKFRFQQSVMCNKKESSGYAKSIHYWKTLRGVKSFVEKQIANGGILSMEVDCYSEREKYIEGYVFVN